MSWEQAWLSYRKNDTYQEKEYFKNIDLKKEGTITENIWNELTAASDKMFGIVPVRKELKEESGIVFAKTEGIHKEGYKIQTENRRIIIQYSEETGALYGAFHLLRLAALNQPLGTLDISEVPSNPLRMINHWDNMDGSIERGYSGGSFFFKDGRVLTGERIKDYARLMASAGINGAVLNNVNVKDEATWLITDRYIQELQEYSEIFSGYGIRLFLSVNFAAPMEIGGLCTADPLDLDVIAWWDAKMQELYSKLPKFGGFLVKADSEGRPGPFTYGRTHADGANLLARAVKPYGGTVIWRCFVYNCQQDWRDKKTDRARSGYDNFKPIDGEFDENVILQIKNGPMDFQVREPVHPLFGGLKSTNQMLEVQAAQEYTGQQRHVCYLVPMWKEVLDYHTFCGKEQDTVADIVSGRTYGQSLCGMAAVSNTGDDCNWTGHDMAGANLYGFGRLAWNTGLSAEDIAEEWIRMVFTNDEEAVSKIMKILMMSWPVYEKYNAPLGIGWMCNPNQHYGPNVDGYEYDRWGTYHRADHQGIGVDRSKNGTGYASLYNGKNAENYENADTCPMELLLFFHHVPYTYVLPDGNTVIQHIYDTHFEGVIGVQEMIRLWKEVREYIRTDLYQRVEKRMEEQKIHSEEWRDVINSYFYRKSMIPDAKKRMIY